MTATRTTAPALGIDRRALRLAAADAGVPVDRLVVVRRERHGKSAQQDRDPSPQARRNTAARNHAHSEYRFVTRS